MENDKLFELMSKMYNDMQDGFGSIRNEMQDRFKEVNSKIDNITKDVSDLKDGQDKIIDKLNNLEGTNAANHVAINSRLEKVSDDLDFLTHKEFQTEKEIFNLRKRLPKQKRNLK